MGKGRFSKTAVKRSVKVKNRSFQVRASVSPPNSKGRGRRSALGGFRMDSPSTARQAGMEVSNATQGGIYSPLFPVDLLEKPFSPDQDRLFYRHFYRRDPFVGRAIDLHCDIPISKTRLKMPECIDVEYGQRVLDFFQEMCRRIKLTHRLRDIAHEYWLFGNAWPFHEWDEENKVWSRIVVLDPGTLNVKAYPFSDVVGVSIRSSDEDKSFLSAARSGMDPKAVEALDDIPPEVLDRLESGEDVPLDTDPYTGSFVCQIARRKSYYEEFGVSILERILDVLLYRDKLRQTQTQIASRSMTPKNLIWGEGLNTDEVNELRNQVDYAIADPDFSIVTNYEVKWQLIGAQERLLNLSSEYEYTDALLTVGLGVTREVLTGEGTYSGNRIGLEIMSTLYMSFRDEISEYVEENVFRPVAVANDFYELDDKGNKKYIYPRLSFTRMALRDTADAFDSLFQLYQKGSVPVSVILDLLNVDPDDAYMRLKEDLFTVNDTNFNELIRTVYTELGRSVATDTNALDRVAIELGVKTKSPEPPDSGEGGGGDSGGDSGGAAPSEGPPEEGEATSDEPPEEAPEEAPSEEAPAEVKGPETPAAPPGAGEKAESKASALSDLGLLGLSLKGGGRKLAVQGRRKGLAVLRDAMGTALEQGSSLRVGSRVCQVKKAWNKR